MRLIINLLALCLALAGVRGQVKDGCPKDNIACLDIINSSQCIEQLIIEHDSPSTQLHWRTVWILQGLVRALCQEP
jgi:hypothetical protein